MNNELRRETVFAQTVDEGDHSEKSSGAFKQQQRQQQQQQQQLSPSLYNPKRIYSKSRFFSLSKDCTSPKIELMEDSSTL